MIWSPKAEYITSIFHKGCLPQISQDYIQYICTNPTHGFYWHKKRDKSGWVAADH